MKFLIISSTSNEEKKAAQRLIKRLREHFELKDVDFTRTSLEVNTKLNTHLVMKCEELIEIHQPDILIFLEIENLDFESVFRTLHYETNKGFFVPQKSPQWILRSINTNTKLEIKNCAEVNFKIIYFKTANNLAVWLKNNLDTMEQSTENQIHIYPPVVESSITEETLKQTVKKVFAEDVAAMA